MIDISNLDEMVEFTSEAQALQVVSEVGKVGNQSSDKYRAASYILRPLIRAKYAKAVKEFLSFNQDDAFSITAYVECMKTWEDREILHALNCKWLNGDIFRAIEANRTAIVKFMWYRDKSKLDRTAVSRAILEYYRSEVLEDDNLRF